MAMPPKFNFFVAPRLTTQRVVLAMAIAVAADGLQLALAPLGWIGIDQAIDLLTAILISWTISFHVLLLPTFLIELVPVLDDLPTWIACTAAVIALRKREQSLHPPTEATNPSKPASEKPAIDV